MRIHRPQLQPLHVAASSQRTPTVGSSTPTLRTSQLHSKATHVCLHITAHIAQIYLPTSSHCIGGIIWKQSPFSAPYKYSCLLFTICMSILCPKLIRSLKGLWSKLALCLLWELARPAPTILASIPKQFLWIKGPPDPFTRCVGDCLLTGKPLQYVTNPLHQLSLPSLWGRLIEYQPVWPRLVEACLLVSGDR